MSRQLKIGIVSYSVEAMRSKTLEEVLEQHKNHRIISPDDVKKAWKACNGFSIPKHLKDQLKGIKPNKGKERSEEKKDSKKSK